MTVSWRAAARDDILRIVTHIADENPTAARRVARELIAAADSLVRFPERGRLGRTPGTRELAFLDPYIIVY